MNNKKLSIYESVKSELYKTNNLGFLKNHQELKQRLKEAISTLDKEKFIRNFEEKITIEEKKRLGQFYTSNRIAEFIIDKMRLTENSLVLDPSCGTGAFLHSCFDYLTKIRNVEENRVLSNIHGIELNEKSLEIAKVSLFTKSSFSQKTLQILNNNLISADSIKTTKEQIFDYFPVVKEKNGFDAIVGNPPYLTLTIGKELRMDQVFSQILCGQINATTLMIGRAYELLKEGGKLGFLLPKTLLRVNSYRNLREFLLSNFRLDYLIDVGQEFRKVRGEQVILIATKGMQSKNQNVTVGNFTIKNNIPETREISLNYITKFNNFVVFNKKSLYNLATKIVGKHKNLDHCCNGKIFRGISIGANSKFVSQIKKKNFLKALRGDSIKKFGYEYFIFLQNRPYPKIDSVKMRKIVLQNIFSSESGIIANYDDKGLITLDTVTNVIPQIENPYYVLGIMNSQLARFFMVFVIYNQSRLTMHADRNYIGRLPIPSTNNKIKNSIIKEVKNRIENRGSDDILNSLVYDAFNLTSNEREVVRSQLESFAKTRGW